MINNPLSVSEAVSRKMMDISIVGVVHLIGAYEATVSIHLTQGLLKKAASVMYDEPTTTVTSHQIRDTAAELTNMVGGNLKCLVPQPTAIELPNVIKSNEFNHYVEDKDTCIELGFYSTEGEMVVAVHERSAA